MKEFSTQKEAREWVISERKYIRNLRADADRFSQLANMCLGAIHAVKKEWELEEDL